MFFFQRSYKALPKTEQTKSDDVIKFSVNDVQNNEKNEFLQLNVKSGQVKNHFLVDNLKSENVSESKSLKWKEIELDTSKLGHYYLKLSKFRLTCKY